MTLGRMLVAAAMVGVLMVPLGWAAVPFDSDASSVLLVGQGTATVQRFGRTAECASANTMVVEASKKPLNLEPVLTIQYLGGEAASDPALQFACAYGHRIQPPQRTLRGDYSGAFGAEHSLNGQTWLFEASAPKADGTRDVVMIVSWENGDRDTFTGTLHEAR